MRYHYYNEARDQFGNTVKEADVYVYLAGTETDASVYTSNSGGTAVSSSPQVSTNSRGFFEFWVDDGDYDHDQKFKLSMVKTGYTFDDIDHIQLFPNLTNFLMSKDDAGNIWYMKPDSADGALIRSTTKGDIVS
uniref:Uncharacterized protein n=1 Tax=viral metagenome TaxID=1070528 RepID=A0A6M3L0N3_9ZZZZ